MVPLIKPNSGRKAYPYYNEATQEPSTKRYSETLSILGVLVYNDRAIYPKTIFYVLRPLFAPPAVARYLQRHHGHSRQSLGVVQGLGFRGLWFQLVSGQSSFYLRFQKYQQTWARL